MENPRSWVKLNSKIEDFVNILFATKPVFNAKKILWKNIGKNIFIGWFEMLKRNGGIVIWRLKILNFSRIKLPKNKKSNESFRSVDVPESSS